MIVCKEFPEKVFENKEEMFNALKSNKKTLIAQKKMITKEADAVIHSSLVLTDEGKALKAETVDLGDVQKLGLKLVINTTNLMDSHSDVHLKGLWKKTVKENKNIYLLQEHRMMFNHIISDEVKATVQLMNWSDLGESYKGQTEALVFDVVIDKRNEFMFNQYAKGYVKNHSVGMRYVKMELAINSESKWDVEEKEIWDKYIDEVANREEADEKGYFWAVTEAKIIEGSAVPIGSNRVTPTLQTENKSEPPKSTQNDKEAALKALQEKQVQFYLNT